MSPNSISMFFPSHDSTRVSVLRSERSRRAGRDSASLGDHVRETGGDGTPLESRSGDGRENHHMGNSSPHGRSHAKQPYGDGNGFFRARGGAACSYFYFDLDTCVTRGGGRKRSRGARTNPSSYGIVGRRH